MTEIYLDNNATTPLLPAAATAMAAAQEAANPASAHAPGRRARRILENAREGIAKTLGAESTGPAPDELIFTSGGTEANNLAILGLALAAIANEQSSPTNPPRIAISAIEHPSIIGPAEHLARHGWKIDRLPVDANGVLQLAAAEAALTPETRLVSVMLGNNETGVLQPIAELAAICRARNILIHTDAVQVTGKLPLNFRELGVDALSITAHKFHGPRGIGALLRRMSAPIAPLLFGGHQQSGLRPGTESPALAAGMHAALASFAADPAARHRHLVELRDSFESLLRRGWPNLVINGANASRLPHTSNVSFPGLDRQALFMALDLAGVACSTGSACASGSNEPSPVLVAMGCDEAVVGGSLRFSFGFANTMEEVAEAANRVLKIAEELTAKKPRIPATHTPHRPAKTL